MECIYHNDAIEANLTRDFISCFNAGGEHLQNYAWKKHLKLYWLKAVPYGPHLEHLSFKIEDQTFFVRFVKKEDLSSILFAVAEKRELACDAFPGTIQGLLRIAAGYNGYPCLMPMDCENTIEWSPSKEGWGLVDARNGEAIIPENLVTGKVIPMTDWEMHDFAVQIVRDNLEAQGKRVLSWNSDPEVMPSLWFEDEIGKKHWVIIQSFIKKSYSPCDLNNPIFQDLKRQMGQHGHPSGYYAEIRLSDAEDFSLPPMRNKAGDCDFDGLIPIL